jgi:hypothetical protein
VLASRNLGDGGEKLLAILNSIDGPRVDNQDFMHRLVRTLSIGSSIGGYINTNSGGSDNSAN